MTTMGEAFGGLAKRVYAALSSPYALLVALAIVAAYFVVGPAIGLPPQPLERSFLLTLATFILSVPHRARGLLRQRGHAGDVRRDHPRPRR